MSPLESTGILQQAWEILLYGLEIRVSTNVLLVDEDVWNRALTGQVLEGGLDSRSIIYSFVSLGSFVRWMG
jgi:hypothetical protein